MQFTVLQSWVSITAISIFFIYKKTDNIRLTNFISRATKYYMSALKPNCDEVSRYEKKKLIQTYNFPGL